MVKCDCDLKAKERICNNVHSVMYLQRYRTCKKTGKTRCRFFEIVRTPKQLADQILWDFRVLNESFVSKTRAPENVLAWKLAVKQWNAEKEQERNATMVAEKLANSQYDFAGHTAEDSDSDADSSDSDRDPIF